MRIIDGLFDDYWAILRNFDTLWLLRFITVLHYMAICLRCETVFIANICFLSLWRNRCSFHLPMCRSQVQIPQDLFFFAELKCIRKLISSPKFIFLSFLSQTHVEIHIFKWIRSSDSFARRLCCVGLFKV